MRRLLAALGIVATLLVPAVALAHKDTDPPHQRYAMGDLKLESGEVIKAARESDKEHLTKELCDLFFHAMVLMADKSITLAELESELGRRHGVSGIDEKASRRK